MKKIYNLVFLSLLASTCTALAMDFVDETEKKPPFSQAANGKMADSEWYDDTVAAGNSPESRERLNGLEADAEALLESLTASAAPSAATKDPLSASVQMRRGLTVLDALAEEAAEDDRDEDERLAVAVGAPAVTVYFELDTPDKEAAKIVLSELIIGKDEFTTNQLSLLLNFLYDPSSNSEIPIAFNFNEFAIRLAACETLDQQNELIDEIEDQHAVPWESDEEESDTAGDVPAVTVYFESDNPDREEAERELLKLVPSGEVGTMFLGEILNLLYKEGCPGVDKLNKIARELDELTSGDAKEGYLIALEEELSAALAEAGSEGSQSEPE